MKRLFTILIACVMLLSVCGCNASALEIRYSDIPDSAWYAEAVYALRDRAIMDGTGNGRFSPDDTFTRAQLATVLYRMAGKPAVNGEDGFTDTDSRTWYSDAVLWASQNGIVNGYGNGMFGTSDPTTQEQLYQNRMSVAMYSEPAR